MPGMPGTGRGFTDIIRELQALQPKGAQYIAIVTRTIYGTSGDELPPPVDRQEYYGYVSLEGETEADFNARIMSIVVPLRRAEWAVRPRPYSWSDGWDWRIAEVKSIQSTTAIEPRNT